MNADGSNLTHITDGYSQDPEWLPNGAELVFAANSEIYVMDANGGNWRNLTNNPALDFQPAVTR